MASIAQSSSNVPNLALLFAGTLPKISLSPPA
jgi:hypothetical protein